MKNVYMYYPDNYQTQVVETIFSLLPYCFLLFCSDLAVFIFPMLLADIQIPNGKSENNLLIWIELHIASTTGAPLFFYFNLETKIKLATGSIPVDNNQF